MKTRKNRRMKGGVNWNPFSKPKPAPVADNGQPVEIKKFQYNPESPESEERMKAVVPQDFTGNDTDRKKLLDEDNAKFEKDKKELLSQSHSLIVFILNAIGGWNSIQTPGKGLLQKIGYSSKPQSKSARGWESKCDSDDCKKRADEIIQALDWIKNHHPAALAKFSATNAFGNTLYNFAGKKLGITNRSATSPPPAVPPPAVPQDSPDSGVEMTSMNSPSPVDQSIPPLPVDQSGQPVPVQPQTTTVGGSRRLRRNRGTRRH
jgi:hypothetical protein